MEYNVLIGGAAGQGIDTVSALFVKVLKRNGYYVFSCKDYMSRIRGGHNFIQVRFGTKAISAHQSELDLILALDDNTIKLHQSRLKEDGLIICDEVLNYDDKFILKVSAAKTAKEIGNPKLANIVLMGSAIKLFGISLNNTKKVIKDKFKIESTDDNIVALQAGYEYVDQQFKSIEAKDDRHILINGNQAMALGALAGGISYYSAYPMTPSTGIMTYLSEKQKEAGIIVEQAEDEIAAINMALGASYGGCRAMTGTSGGGFALMTETLGLSVITETPLVVVNVQRPGPATGFPTRTEQGDLSFVLSATHGEAPRMVIAVRNAEDAFYQTFRALNIADKYQMLVILLSDQYVADSVITIPPYDFSNLKIERYIDEEDNLTTIEENKYERYKLTETGISPRITPGKFEGYTVLADSHVHDESGHISESAEVRIMMMRKRMKKFELLKVEILEPEYMGDENPGLLLIGWGSTYGAIKEATELMRSDGISVGALVFGDIWPLPLKLLKKYSAKAQKIINVEQNSTGQFAALVRQEAGISIDYSILKYDGRQIGPVDICNSVKSEVL